MCHASKYPRPAVIEFSLNFREGAALCSREDHCLQTVYKYRGNFKNLWVEWKTCLPLLFVVWLLNRVQLFATPWTRAPQGSLSFTIRVRSNSWPLSQWCYLTISSSATLFSFCLQSFPESWSFPVSWLVPSVGRWNFSISPSNEYSGLISLRIDWFDLLAVQETLKSLLQHHNLKASVLQHSALPSLWSTSHIRTWLLEKP